ncbi:uncharacterized protein LOC122844026 [Gambusia affinis]|uniref:uncharacterized protein LOC122844026 n=1 Tax=Gambusia affinis TaxID=33528 RepID=UPI001CDD0418|nr:uncharacterized protein LOC122844026 [Gambusia affinis]
MQGLRSRMRFSQWGLLHSDTVCSTDEAFGVWEVLVLLQKQHVSDSRGRKEKEALRFGGGRKNGGRRGSRGIWTMLDQRPNIPVDDTFSGGANSNMVADPVQVFMETFRRDNAPYQLLQKCLRSGLIWPSNSPESTLEAPLPTFQSQNPQRAFSGPMRSGSGRVWRQRLLITEMCPESSGESNPGAEKPDTPLSFSPDQRHRSTQGDRLPAAPEGGSLQVQACEVL